MISLIEGAKRKKTPNEIALNILLSALTIIFLLVCVGLRPFGSYIHGYTPSLSESAFSVTVLIALLVCLIPTTIGGLLSAIGIAGIDRMVQKNVLAMSGKAVEAAGDVHVLLLDKTGTITIGNRQAVAFYPGSRNRADRHRRRGQAGIAWPTRRRRARASCPRPEGRRQRSTHRLRPAGGRVHRVHGPDAHERRRRRRSLHPQGRGGRHSRLGRKAVSGRSGGQVETIAKSGGTPLVVADKQAVLGTIHLKDIVKEGLAERFHRFRAMGIRTVMITGDNKLTAQAIAAEAGVDDFLAQAKPEEKLALIRKEQAAGYLVAMTGDGTNDAPALAQADVGVAMNSGTQAAKEAGNMVDLDSNPTKLIEIVEIGKQMLMTRGALTTFSVANDVAKYFAIIPAMLVGAFPEIRAAQRHEAREPLERDPERRHLQRAHHHLPRPARAARREVPRARRRRGTAAQPARLRPRRAHRAVRRHQGHRPRRLQSPAPGVTMQSIAQAPRPSPFIASRRSP